VVAVGLKLVEPLALVEVNVPGVMAIVVAPDVAQLSVTLPPEVIVFALAVKELMAGAVPVPFEPEGELTPAQPPSAAQPKRTRSNAARGCKRAQLRPAAGKLLAEMSDRSRIRIADKCRVRICGEATGRKGKGGAVASGGEETGVIVHGGRWAK